MIVGFTGTRMGMTPRQASEVLRLVSGLNPAEVHHGDCEGADEEFHRLVVNLWPVVLHPPDSPTLRAFCEDAMELRPELPFLKRNREIVGACDVLIATPGSRSEPTGQRGGGTWYTIRHARRQGVPTVIVWPNGRIERRAGDRVT